jgi:hypothetical protein
MLTEDDAVHQKMVVIDGSIQFPSFFNFLFSLDGMFSDESMNFFAGWAHILR